MMVDPRIEQHLIQGDPVLRPPPEPGRTGLLFGIGGILAAVAAPLTLFYLVPAASGPPGIREGWIGVGADMGILSVTVAISWFSFLFGRAVRRRRRRPRFQTIASPIYLVVGAAVPCLFLWFSRASDLMARTPGLLWLVGIGGPFLIGLYTAPRGAAALIDPVLRFHEFPNRSDEDAKDSGRIAGERE